MLQLTMQILLNKFVASSSLSLKSCVESSQRKWLCQRCVITWFSIQRQRVISHPMTTLNVKVKLFILESVMLRAKPPIRPV